MSSLLPLLPSSNCSVVVQTAPWAGPWKPTLALRFRNASAPAFGAARPRLLVPLFEGGVFDPTYNNRTPVEVQVPSWATRASIVAVITGAHWLGMLVVVAWVNTHKGWHACRTW